MCTHSVHTVRRENYKGPPIALPPWTMDKFIVKGKIPLTESEQTASKSVPASLSTTKESLFVVTNINKENICAQTDPSQNQNLSAQQCKYQLTNFFCIKLKLTKENNFKGSRIKLI